MATKHIAPDNAPIVLVDMDGVVADWQAEFDFQLENTLPHIERIPFENITSFKTQKFYADEHQEDIQRMLNAPGFYRNLKPYEGVVEALKELEQRYRIYLCTAPYVTNATCASEKMEWVDTYLGHEWMEKMVITSDKTIVYGDVLIDDKPKITGAMNPVWKHVVFDAPYNRDSELRINSWAEGVEVIDGIFANTN